MGAGLAPSPSMKASARKATESGMRLMACIVFLSLGVFLVFHRCFTEPNSARNTRVKLGVAVPQHHLDTITCVSKPCLTTEFWHSGTLGPRFSVPMVVLTLAYYLTIHNDQIGSLSLTRLCATAATGTWSIIPNNGAVWVATLALALGLFLGSRHPAAQWYYMYLLLEQC